MKFHIKDEDGKAYTVEEVIEKETQDEEIETETEVTPDLQDDDALGLTEDEITALKSLAKVAPKLLELLSVEEKEHEDNPELLDEDEEEIEEDEDEEMIDDEDFEEEKEEVIETKSHDSKKSFGAIESHKTSVDDSMDDDISSVWANRYNKHLGGSN